MKVIHQRARPGVGLHGSARKEPRPEAPDTFRPGQHLAARALATKLADQTENLRLYREVFPEGQPWRDDVAVLFVSFKGDERFVTKTLNAAAGNTLVKEDWAERLSQVLGSLEGTEHGGYRVKVLEHFYGMASLALVPVEGKAHRSPDAAANELRDALSGQAARELSAFLDRARDEWARQTGAEAGHQVELLDKLRAQLRERAPQLVAQGVSQVRPSPRTDPVFALLSAVYRARAAATLEGLKHDRGDEVFDAGKLLAALKDARGFAGAWERLRTAEVSLGPVTLPVEHSDAVTGTRQLNAEVLRLLREKASLTAAPGVLEDLDLLVQQAALLDFVSFEPIAELARDGTRELESAARAQVELLEHPRSHSARATAACLLAPTRDGVLVAQYGTPSEQAFFERNATARHTVYLSVDIKALGATAQGAMIRQAVELIRQDTARADDVFYRALAANDEVVARKTAVLGPIGAALREAAHGQALSVLAFGDEAVFALSDWDEAPLQRAVQAAGAAVGARLVMTETTAPEGETRQQALSRHRQAQGASDGGNETLKAVEHHREVARYRAQALDEPQRSAELRRIDDAVASHVVAKVTEAGVQLIDARTAQTFTLEDVEASLG